MSRHINLVKLCVGAETVDDLAAWQAQRAARGADGAVRHVTRMWPKRQAELVDGGSLYWVIRGVILVRQQVLRLDEVVGGDGILRCGIVLEDRLVRTRPAPRRPFQGWRYLRAEDAPADLPESREGEEPLPAELESALADLGVL